MKKQVVVVLTRIGFLSVMALVTAWGSAQGQSLAYRIKANIPFDFVVADKKMPAGQYFIGRVLQDVDDSFLVISSVKGEASAVRSTIPVETQVPKDKGTLVFHRYGDQYFLFQVWPAGASTGRVLSKSRSEREIERNLATNSSGGKMTKNVGAVETVTIAAGLQ